MRRVADTREDPIVVPVVGVPVDVRVAIVVRPAIEGGRFVRCAIRITALRILSGLNLIRDLKSHSTSHQVSSFLELSRSALSATVVAATLGSRDTDLGSEQP